MEIIKTISGLGISMTAGLKFGLKTVGRIALGIVSVLVVFFETVFLFTDLNQKHPSIQQTEDLVKILNNIKA